MEKNVLAIGPVTKDIIITKGDTYTQIGGAVYYQCCALHQLKTSVESIISIGENDLKLANKFPNKTHKIITKETMQYTNIYDKNLTRTQRAILPNNPITVDKLEKLKIKPRDYKTILLSPLCTTDIPSETIKFFKDNEVVLLPQGYLRRSNKEHEIESISWKNYHKYLKYVDILCLDDNEIKIAFNMNEVKEEDIIQIIEENNLRTLIVTKAEHGSDIYTKDKHISIPAIRTDNIVDPTGLGDTYIASYISKKQENISEFEAGLFASLTAKYKLETKGSLNISKENIEKEFKKVLKRIKLED